MVLASFLISLVPTALVFWQEAVVRHVVGLSHCRVPRHNHILSVMAWVAVLSVYHLYTTTVRLVLTYRSVWNQ